MRSWLAIKDSLTHRPSSQGWAPGVLLSCYVCVFVNVVSIDVCGFFFISLYGCYRVLGDISFLTFYYVSMAGVLYTMVSYVGL